MAFFQCFTFKFTTSNLFANSNMLDPKVRKGLKKKYYGQKYVFQGIINCGLINDNQAKNVVKTICESQFESIFQSVC